MAVPEEVTVYGWLMTCSGEQATAVLVAGPWVAALSNSPGSGGPGGWYADYDKDAIRQTDQGSFFRVSSDYALRVASKYTDFYVSRGYTVAIPAPVSFAVTVTDEQRRFLTIAEGWRAHLASDEKLRAVKLYG